MGASLARGLNPRQALGGLPDVCNALNKQTPFHWVRGNREDDDKGVWESDGRTVTDWLPEATGIRRGSMFIQRVDGGACYCTSV